MESNVTLEYDESTSKFTETEIIEKFSKLTNINEEFKNIVLTRIDGLMQAMYNCTIKDRDKYMTLANPWGDSWVEEYNRFVELYQRYHD